MNPRIKKLAEISAKKSRTIIGLMSGTSLDGLDIACCEVSGNGMNTNVELKHFVTIPYRKDIKKRLKSISSVKSVEMDKFCYEHTALGQLHAQMIISALDDWNLSPDEIDCIASHGQTVYHLPARDHQFDSNLNTTLQIADGDQIAVATGILTVSDFRQKHTAFEGEGAPLAGLVDRLLFQNPKEDRILLNVGGIGNYTFLPKDLSESEIPFTTDTGPGNTLIDQWMQKKYDRPFDRNSEVALSGNIIPELVETCLADKWFSGEQTKSTGPEYFNITWLHSKANQVEIDLDHIKPEDVAATITELSARSISISIQQNLKNLQPAVYVSGGGAHNPYLMQRLQFYLEGLSIWDFSKLGIDPDAKEAVLFAVLANETLSGSGFLFVNEGNSRRINLGKISFPD